MQVKCLSLILFSIIGLSTASSTDRDDTYRESIRLVVTQKLFDNIQENLVDPLVKKLEGSTFEDLAPINLDIEFMQIAANFTNMEIQNCSLSDKIKLLEL